MEETTLLSKCHNAPVEAIRPEPQGGHKYECKVCGNPCELKESMPNEEKKVEDTGAAGAEDAGKEEQKSDAEKGTDTGAAEKNESDSE